MVFFIYKYISLLFCLLLVSSLYYLYGQKCKSYSFTSFIKWNLYSWCIKFICKLLVSFCCCCILTLFIFFHVLNILQSDSISLHLRITNTKLDDIKRCQSEKNKKLMIKGHLILLYIFFSFKILFFLNNNQCMILL